MRAPQPAHGRGHHPSNQANGVGHIYMKFMDVSGAVVGMKVLAGCSFVGQSIIMTLLGKDS